MKWQFQHEDHNRQEKAKKPDYQQAFAAPFEPGGTRGNRIVLADMMNFGTVLRKTMAQDKQTAWHVFESKLRSQLLKVDGYSFSFKHDITKFAASNGLSAADAQRLLPKLQKTAEEFLRVTRGRFNAAQPSGRWETAPDGGKPKVEWYLTFRSFLPTAQPQPWRTFYKRLRLDPRDVEIESS
jgi:hypothetical protein